MRKNQNVVCRVLVAAVASGMLAACGAVPRPHESVATTVPTVVPGTAAPVEMGATVKLSPTPAELVSPVPGEATSRGPDLEATDPRAVALISGGLQLIEFFRFT